MPRKKQPINKQLAEVFELEVTLLDTTPPIWRRLAISSLATLADLHEAIQIAMGWTNSHLHQFVTKDGRRFKAPNPYMDDLGGCDDMDDDILPAGEHTLDSLRKELKKKIAYEYDFGDGWVHVVRLVSVRAPEADEQLPFCLDGKMACPPEDCGGVPGYYHLLDVISDPKHAEYEDLIEWVGDDFDPEAFDIVEVNGLLNG